MHSADVIGKDYLKKQALFVGLADLATALFIHLNPEWPVDGRLAPILAAASVPYFIFFMLFDRCGECLHKAIMALSLVGVAALGFVTHMTGGIVSPLTCFYFALLVSEVGYGVASPLTMYASVVSYLCVVLGEAFGFLAVSDPLAKAIYANPSVLIFIVLSVTSHLVITGYISKLILKKMRLDFTAEQEGRHAALKRFSELDAYSHIGMLAHRIVHDLRAPLASISGYVQLEMAAAGKNAEEKAALGDLDATVTKMTDSLASVTRYGRVAGGAAQKIMVKDFFKSLVSILGYYKDACGVQFRRNYPEAGDFCVMAVRQDLQQAYFNILKNAVEAVGKNTGDKIVEVAMRAEKGALEISISNNGPHIPEEILAKIFKEGVTGKPEGTGVGMLITHDLLMKNDIGIKIRNMEGSGVKIITEMQICTDGKPQEKGG